MLYSGLNQASMSNLQIQERKDKGNNRYHMPKVRRLARRKMQKASRKANRR